MQWRQYLQYHNSERPQASTRRRANHTPSPYLTQLAATCSNRHDKQAKHIQRRRYLRLFCLNTCTIGVVSERPCLSQAESFLLHSMYSPHTGCDESYISETKKNRPCDNKKRRPHLPGRLITSHLLPEQLPDPDTSPQPFEDPDAVPGSRLC